MFDKGQALLLWALECQQEVAPEWNEWYNLEHLAALVQVPGFLSGNRYEQIEETPLPYLDHSVSAPIYLSYYELYDESVLQSEAYHINRTSTGPGMRPEWTKRMLTYITKIMGGTYKPISDTWIEGSDRSAHKVWALYINPEENCDHRIDDWYYEYLLPLLQKSGLVKAARLFGTQQSAPKVLGGVQQLGGPRRVVLTTVHDDFGSEALTNNQEPWILAKNFINTAQGVLYKRLPI